jgi:proteic killer suppression protein
MLVSPIYGDQGIISQAIEMYVFFTYSRFVKINLSRLAKSQLKKIPDHIFRKYLYWLDLIETIGLLEARKYQGFHDEPLRGRRNGQRSVRLSKSYRLIYRQLQESKFEVIEIIEVNKHEY